TFDESLGFAEAQAGDGADFLDHVDLVVAEGGQNNVELGLLFGGSRRSSTGARSGRNGDRSDGGDAPLLFEQLGQFRGLEDREGREVVYDFGEISHLILPVCFVSVRTRRSHGTVRV